MDKPGDYSQLPPRVAADAMVQEVTPYEAVEEVRGVRRVSPLSPLSGIEEARLYGEVATSSDLPAGRRRLARAVAFSLLVMTVSGLLTFAYGVWRFVTWSG